MPCKGGASSARISDATATQNNARAGRAAQKGIGVGAPVVAIVCKRCESVGRRGESDLRAPDHRIYERRTTVSVLFLLSLDVW